MNRKTFAATAVLIAAGAGAWLGTSAASAASAPSPVHHASFFGCFTHNGAGAASIVTGHPNDCPAGSIDVQGDKGTQGPAGPAGPAGAPGKDGASGTSGATVKDLGAVASVATGGSFAATATLVGTVNLKAGTYLVSLNAKATPLMTSAVQVFPQFFVYDQAANASFTGDLFNVGAGALESGGNVNIDSYYSGSSVITLASDVTLDIYADGYDSDRGAGTYALDDLTVTAVRLQAAS